MNKEAMIGPRQQAPLQLPLQHLLQNELLLLSLVVECVSQRAQCYSRYFWLQILFKECRHNVFFLGFTIPAHKCRYDFSVDNFLWAKHSHYTQYCCFSFCVRHFPQSSAYTFLGLYKAWC
eukprot:jgi/Botrbrau1/23299/Bobra.0102s0040.1